MEETQDEELKQLINSSPIFEINKEESPVLYDTEKGKLWLNLYNLYSKRYDGDCTVEVEEALEECLKYYDKTKSDFLCYFYPSFKKRINEKIRNDNNHGINIPKKVSPTIKYINSKLKSSGKTLDYLTYDNIEEIYGETLSDKEKEKLMSAIMIQYKKGNFVPIKTSQSDEEDGISEDVLSDNKEDISTKIEAIENFSEILNQIEVVYKNNIRSDTKNMFKIFITRKLLESNKIYVEFFKNKEFFDVWTYNFYNKKGTLPKNIDIAKHENRLEEKVSSLFKNFREKLDHLQSMQKP